MTDFLPTRCDSCGEIFATPNPISGTGTMVMTGNRAGPCPYCGGYGSLPDGTFKIVDSAIEVLAAQGERMTSSGSLTS